MSSETRLREAVQISVKRLWEQHAATLEAAINTFIEAAFAERDAEVVDARAQVEAAAQRTLEERLLQARTQADAQLAEARAAVSAEAQRRVEKAKAEADASLSDALKRSAAEVANARAEVKAARDQAAEVQAAAEDARREAAGARAEKETAREELAQVRFELARVRDELARARAQIYNVVKAVSEVHGVEQETDLASTSRLLDAIKTLDDARSLSDVLDVLVHRARREGARAAMLLVRGDQIFGWRLAGFDSAVPDPRAIQLNLNGSGAIVEAVRSGVPKTVGPQSSGLDFAPLPAGRAGLAVPVQVGGRTVAVLYADDFGVEAVPVPNGWSEAVELLVRHAGRCLETIAALQTVTEETD